jgi:hypothetical protein
MSRRKIDNRIGGGKKEPEGRAGGRIGWKTDQYRTGGRIGSRTDYRTAARAVGDEVRGWNERQEGQWSLPPPSIPHSPRISLVFFIGFTCLFQAFGGICTSSLFVETPQRLLGVWDRKKNVVNRIYLKSSSRENLTNDYSQWGYPLRLPWLLTCYETHLTSFYEDDIFPFF